MSSRIARKKLDSRSSDRLAAKVRDLAAECNVAIGNDPRITQLLLSWREVLKEHTR